jgi:hypothetical protein
MEGLCDERDDEARDHHDQEHRNDDVRGEVHGLSAQTSTPVRTNETTTHDSP